MVTAHLDPRPFLSPAEVGALLNVKAETVVRWTKAGRLRCVYTSQRAAPLSQGRPCRPASRADGARDDCPSRKTGRRYAGPGGLEPGTPARGLQTAGAVVVAEAVLTAAEADAELAREAVEVATAEVLVAAQKVAAAAARAHAVA